MNLLERFGKWSITINLSGLFRVPPAPPPEPPEPTTSSFVADANAAVQKQIDQP